MFRPGGYAPQYRHGPPGTSVQGHPVHGPAMHGSGPGFPGGYQQNIGFGHPPTMPPQASHAPPGFTPIPYVENQGTHPLQPSYGMMASMQPLEPQHFPGPPPGQPFHGQPPRYPLPPPPNFNGALLPGPPVNMQTPTLPLRPTFSPVLPPQLSSGNQLSQSFTPSHMVPQHAPQPPFLVGEVSQPLPPLHTLPEGLAQPPLPPPTFSVSQSSSSLHTQQFNLPESTLSQLASGTSQSLPASTDMSNPLLPSHLITLPPPPQTPNKQMKNGQGAEGQGQFAEQSEPPLNVYQGTDPVFESQAVSMSPAVSDVDMEDDFAVTVTKDDQDLHSNPPSGISSLNEKENKNVSYNMIIKATDSGEKEEVMPMNVAHMDFSQSELQGKEERSHSTSEQQHVEEMTPVKSTGIEFQQITKNSVNIHNQALNYEGYENASSIEEQKAGSYVTPGSFNLVRNYQVMMPEYLAHGHVGTIHGDSRMPEIMGFAGRNGENMEFDKFEHNKGQAFEHNHVSNGLGDASIPVQGQSQPSSWTNDARQGHDNNKVEGNVPAEKRTGSPINEGTSDSESDEVLYTANGLQRGRRSSSNQSPGNSRLRSCSRSPRRHRSRTRSPRRGCDTKDGEQEKGTCLNFERGMCYEGSSCRFVHHKAGANSIVDYSDEESEEGKCLKEMEQDHKGNSTSPGKKSDGHDSSVAREEKKHEVSKNDDSSGKVEKSPEWDLDFASESYSAYFDREIFQPSVLHREGSESQRLRRDDFRPLPLRKEDFEPQILSREDIPSQPFQREGLQPLPLQREGLRAQLLHGDDLLAHRLKREDGRTPLLLQREGLLSPPLRREDMHPQFIRGEDSRARLLNREEGRPSLLPHEDMQRMHKQPFLQEDLRAKAFIQDDLRAHPLFHEDVRARPLFREDVELSQDRARADSFSREYLRAPLLRKELHAHPLRCEDIRSLPLLRGASSGQPLLRDDFQVPSLLSDDLNRVKQLRRDILLDPLHRGNLRSNDEELQYRALLREEIRAQHLLREKSRLNAEGFLPREDLHPRLLSREEARLKALVRDFSSNQLDVSMGKIDPLLYRNPSIQKNIALPVNSSFSPHLDLMRNTGPSLLGRTSSFLNHPREVSFLGERHTLHSEVPFRMNANPLSQPDLVPSVPHTLPPHSPRNTSPQNIYRTGVQPQPTYRYSNDRGPSVPALSSQRGSTPGGPYDTWHDSTDPALRSKLFDIYRGEQIDPMGAVMVSDVRQQLADVYHENDSGNAKTSAPVQPGNAKDSYKADYAVEAATDAEVGVVDNESPQLVREREGSPGHHLDVTTTGAGEIDVDQTHANEKTRNIKEIKAMKVFRMALAELAKELLKPTWREGHMSKEAFKLIVKKAVDKVAGTLQSHQIPNTQERIDQYLESSRVKFTKLIEGYVEKYVKV
ncbi:hypothetical protein SUGI_0180850 [Cryptomeria japonica]|nr:hypothetical protein SUGI_0180850 [Cryptomeria japonica]